MQILITHIISEYDMAGQYLILYYIFSASKLRALVSLFVVISLIDIYLNIITSIFT